MSRILLALIFLATCGCGSANSGAFVTPLKQNRGALVTMLLDGWGGAHILVLVPERTVMDRHSFFITPWKSRAGFLLRRDFDRRHLEFEVVESSKVLEFEGQQWPMNGNNTLLLVLDDNLSGGLKPLPFRSTRTYADEILNELKDALPNETRLKSLDADMNRVRMGG